MEHKLVVTCVWFCHVCHLTLVATFQDDLCKHLLGQLMPCMVQLYVFHFVLYVISSILDLVVIINNNYIIREPNINYIENINDTFWK